MLQFVKSKVKKFVLIISGKVSHLKIGLKCKSSWYGNSYGGFYVCPENLTKESIVYSFGIGEDISFDEAIIKNHGCHVFGFDPTPKSISWIKNYNVSETFHFYEYGISNVNGLADFYLPKNPEYVSGSIIVQNNIDVREKIIVNMKSLKNIVNELGHKSIDILKMDIEGAEYEVIDDILNSEIRINQILVEFHERFVENGKLKSQEAIRKMNVKGYEIFAISDSFEEISFIKLAQ